MKQRIYRYDNIKALLIFLVVLGHMTTDYVSDSHLVRWTTLWIYTFHMPAFIFLSGLVHKHYITNEKASLGIKGETRMRWDKFLGFFLCGYALKIFLQYSRTLMGQHPIWHWFEEPGIPWYLIVMAEYELLFYMIRNRGIALTREKLISDVWGYDFFGDDRTLDTHIKLLRKQLGPYADRITTLRGVGYRFEKE